jgi:hypothetical protein
MILYGLVIGIMATIVFIINHFCYAPIFEAANIFFPWWFNLVSIIVFILLAIAIDGLFAHIAHKLQPKLNYQSKYFTVSLKQTRILKRFGVKKFKDYLPDLGFLAGFKKGRIAEPKNPEYLLKYIKESCDGELGHLLGAVFGFGLIFIYPLHYWLCFGLPVALINMVLSIMPVMALRYNRYALMLVYQRMVRQQNAEAKTE